MAVDHGKKKKFFGNVKSAVFSGFSAGTVEDVQSLRTKLDKGCGAAVVCVRMRVCLGKWFCLHPAITLFSFPHVHAPLPAYSGETPDSKVISEHLQVRWGAGGSCVVYSLVISRVVLTGPPHTPRTPHRSIVCSKPNSRSGKHSWR